MKISKKILYLFLIIFTLSFSTGEDKSKVILDKKREAAELKIGVTKLISEELPLEFHIENKKIYGEIDIDDNDLIFVSETLDEIPSVSTTNGRRTINNIKKYLTKEIKNSPKFEYQIVKDEEKQKKYLLVDCKTQLSGIYIYIVEQGSYKVKKVYKGVFQQLLNTQTRSANYGTIYFNKEHPLTSKISTINYNGSNILVNGKNTNSAAIEGTGGFPKKFTGDLSGATYKGYNIKVKNSKSGTGSEQIFPSSHYQYFEDGKYNPDKKIIRMAVNLYGKLVNPETGTEQEGVVGKLRITSKENDTYLNFEILLNYSMVDIENEITINYGHSWGSDDVGTLDIRHSDTFKIKIDGKEPSDLPPNTQGILTILKGEQLYNTPTTIEGVSDSSVKSNNSKADVRFDGEYLKVFNGEDVSAGQKVLKITVENRNRLKTKEQEIVIDDGNGNIKDTYGAAFPLYDVFGVQAGNINVSKITAQDKYYTIKISDFPKITEMVNSNIILEYIIRPLDENGKDKDKVIKEDFVTLYIKPIEQNIPKGTHGKLVLYTTEDLRNNDFYTEDGILKTKRSGGGVTDTHYKPYNLSKSRYSDIPLRLENNKGDINNKDTSWVYWGEEARVLIEGPHVNNEIKFQNRDDGTFITYDDIGDSGWIQLRDTKGNEVKKGWIQFNMENNMESLTIGFRGSELGHRPTIVADFELEEGQVVDSVYHIKYEARINTRGENGTTVEKWYTVKEDTIEIIIDPTMKQNEKKITLSNPLVYYDYESSSAISNIVHNKRVHLSGKEAKTLTSGGTEFNKNTDLDGKKWIETDRDVIDYTTYNKKHRVTIRKDSSEVIKTTDKNGRTPSSTFIGDSNTITSNSRDGRGNEVMFSYDGGNRYLNFGLSKYNFEGTTIKDVIITNDGIVDNDGGDVTDNSSDREIFTIKIPRFEGIHYVNPNYDIKPRQDYTKNHVFDHETGNKEIIIDYGTVGFRDLDTRITEESGGKGIEIRAFRYVTLQSVSDPNYIIKGAELYFEDEKTDGNVTYFKGTNEKATSKLLKLKIPTQETLIPKDKFKILTDETIPTYPLKVGVTVKDDKTSYYTQIDDESVGEEGKNLYLNLSTRRFVETVLEFENPDLKTENNNINWIKLNKSQYSGGRLTRPIGNSDLWGKVRGETIDIPLISEAGTHFNLKMKVFQEDFDGKEKEILSDLKNKKLELTIPGTQDKHFVMQYTEGDKHIEFSLDNGYDEINDINKEIVFYIRYYDLATDKFLFDQKYTVKFKPKVDYLTDSTLKIKNPSMVSTADNGRVLLKAQGKAIGENNNNTFDSITWYEVQNSINYKEKNENAESFILRKIGLSEEYKYYKINDSGFLEIGIPDNKNNFESSFDLNDYKAGKDIETSFSLEAKYTNADSKYYRVNILIEKFDPRYYGKVYPAENTESINGTYNEINKTGEGNFDLREYVADEYVYIDLGTKYRDYSRYKNILEALEGSKIKIGVENNNDVEVVAKDNGSAVVVKGKVVFKDGENYLSEKTISAIDSSNPTASPKNYPLYLKLTQEEYRKLKSYTTYELFLNGNPNIFTFEVERNPVLNKEMIFDKPLRFKTEGPSIKIIPEILDFGQIKLSEYKDPLAVKSATAEIKVIIEDKLAEEFTTVLEPETDEIQIQEKNAAGEIIENGEKLKVRSITVESKTQNGTTATGKRQDDFIISGVLEVPNKAETKRAKYGGYIIVNFTYY